MPTLLLRLSGPLQAWGTSSRFSQRQTERFPSKSGLIGLLAAADGRRRTENIEDLAQLSVGVRADQPGRVMRDFQTARSLDGKRNMPLSNRYYLQDAVFVAGIYSDDADMIEKLAAAIRSPYFPLYLGRRSCVPDRSIYIDVVPEGLVAALKSTPWQASPSYRKKRKNRVERLELIYDAEDDTSEVLRDYPVSFNPEHRQYSLRPVQRSEVEIVIEDIPEQTDLQHSPMEGLN